MENVNSGLAEHGDKAAVADVIAEIRAAEDACKQALAAAQEQARQIARTAEAERDSIFSAGASAIKEMQIKSRADAETAATAAYGKRVAEGESEAAKLKKTEGQAIDAAVQTVVTAVLKKYVDN